MKKLWTSIVSFFQSLIPQFIKAVFIWLFHRKELKTYNQAIAQMLKEKEDKRTRRELAKRFLRQNMARQVIALRSQSAEGETAALVVGMLGRGYMVDIKVLMLDCALVVDRSMYNTPSFKNNKSPWFAKWLQALINHSTLHFNIFKTKNLLSEPCKTIIYGADPTEPLSKEGDEASGLTFVSEDEFARICKELSEKGRVSVDHWLVR